MVCGSVDIFWLKNDAESAHSFVQYTKVVGGKAAQFAYPMHVVLLDVSVLYQTWIIKINHALFAFLSLYGERREGD